MPICPNCHTQQAQAKNDACPHCFCPVVVTALGEWELEVGKNVSAKHLISYWCGLVSAQQTARAKHPVYFHIAKRSAAYKRELHIANQLLKQADNSIMLAIEAMDILYTDSQFAWKCRTTLVGLQADYILALAIARARAEARQKQDQQEAENYDNVSQRSQFFSGNSAI